MGTWEGLPQAQLANDGCVIRTSTLPSKGPQWRPVLTGVVYVITWQLLVFMCSHRFTPLCKARQVCSSDFLCGLGLHPPHINSSFCFFLSSEIGDTTVPELCLGRLYIKAFFKAEDYTLGGSCLMKGYVLYFLFSTFEHAYVKLRKRYLVVRSHVFKQTVRLSFCLPFQGPLVPALYTRAVWHVWW